MTAELKFLTPAAASAFEANLHSSIEYLNAPTSEDPILSRLRAIAAATKPGLQFLQSITFTRFDTIRSLWSYETGSTKVHVRI